MIKNAIDSYITWTEDTILTDSNLADDCARISQNIQQLQFHCTAHRIVCQWYLKKKRGNNQEAKWVPAEKCLREIPMITYRNTITNEEALRRTNQTRLSDIVPERRIGLAGHVLRMPEIHHVLTALKWTPEEGKRKQGQSKKRRRSTFWRGPESNADQVDRHTNCCIGQNKLKETSALWVTLRGKDYGLGTAADWCRNKTD